jgi:2-dehydropantoate 2-reductase
MKFLVFGTGGVGGYFGGRLAQAGEDVTFIARGNHLRAILDSGLRVDSIGGDFLIRPARATDSVRALQCPDVILLAVKSFQLDDAIDRILPLVEEDTVILPLLNGIDHIDTLVREFGQEHVLGGMCRISAFIAAPGYIKHVAIDPYIAFGELDKTPSERVLNIFNAFRKISGSTFEAHDDIVLAMWEKYLLISAFSGVGAVTRQPIGVFRSIPESRAMFRRALEEVVLIANARGVPLSENSVQAVMDRIDNTQPDAMASMQKDIIAGHPSELEAQTGALVRMAHDLGVYIPTQEFIYASLLPMEKKARG